MEHISARDKNFPSAKDGWAHTWRALW